MRHMMGNAGEGRNWRSTWGGKRVHGHEVSTCALTHGTVKGMQRHNERNALQGMQWRNGRNGTWHNGRKAMAKQKKCNGTTEGMQWRNGRNGTWHKGRKQWRNGRHALKERRMAQWKECREKQPELRFIGKKTNQGRSCNGLAIV
eukprot:695179-Pelagomonas_calceolata.AAC.3